MELFEKPIYFLYFLLTAGLVGFVCWLGAKRKQHIINLLFCSASYTRLSGGKNRFRPLQITLAIFAMFFLFAALAKPQWGLEIVKAEGNFAQTVIAVDVSSSMRARDLHPDRLASAKNMLRMLISHLPNDRIGLIAFTSKAYIQCPITTDDEALKYFVSTLQPDMLPLAGTSLAEPVKLAAHMLSKYPGKKGLILLTDGEDHTPEELKEAKSIAQKEGIRIIAVGLGTPDGELIPQRIDVSGKVLEYKKDREGKTVITKLDEKSLAELAAATQGMYIKYTNPSQVAARVEEAVRNLDKSRTASSSHTSYKNRYQIPLALAILCLLGVIGLPFCPTRKEKTAETDIKKVQ